LKSSTAALVHADAPPAASVEVMMLPAWLTMAHSPPVVHHIPPVQLVVPVTSTAPEIHAERPPVGSVEATSSLHESPAAHRVAVGHEIALIQLPESTL
jgi:hypothetical protein